MTVWILWLNLAGVTLVFFTAIIGFLATRRKATAIQVVLDGRLTAVIARVDQLTAELNKHGIDLPPDPNKMGGV